MESSSVEKLHKIHQQFPAKNVNVIHKSKLTALDKLALFVTEKIGTLGFFFIILIWTLVWLGWNVFAPKKLRFDPYPAFVLWLFISNLIQLHLLPLIMIGQNIQGKHAELRAEHDFETDKKAEQEIKLVLQHLEKQEKMLEKLIEQKNKKRVVS